MKLVLAIVTLVCASKSFSQDAVFRWSLPPLSEATKLTADMFPGADAVYILREQVYTEEPHSRSLFALRNEVTTESKSFIAKVFNDAAVQDIGSFEYEYPNRRFEQARNEFHVHARIMKPDGTVFVMPDSAVSTVAGTASGRGRALRNKVLFKLSNLAPGDVVQIEYSHIVPFSFTRRVLFFYHARYPILTSTVRILMDKKQKVDYLSFPPDKIVASPPEELSTVRSRSWTVKNLAFIPHEPFSRPFEDVSYMTAMIDHTDEEDGNGWRPLAKNFIRDHLNDGSVPKAFMNEIGLDAALRNPGWSDIEHAYTALCHYFRLMDDHGPAALYPDGQHVAELIEGKVANPTNLAFLMYKIMTRWEIPATPLLIRDRRQGAYETSVSSEVWFDRLGLLVSLGGNDKLFDFDRSIPSRFEFPWFLNGTNVLALHDTGATHVSVGLPFNLRDHTSRESHFVTLTHGRTPVDSVLFFLHGAAAQRLRGELYPVRGEDLDRRLRSLVMENALQDVDTVSINKFLDEWQILVHGRGVSQAATTEMDSFLTFRPRNHFLRALRGKFTAGQRYGDICFDERFCYTVQWTVHAPAGYTSVQVPEPLTVEGGPGVHAEISWFVQESSTCVAKADVVVDTDVIGKDKYRDWLGFLDKTTKAMEHEITFKRE